MLNELLLARALYRGALFVVALVAMVLLGVQLKWVLVQLFAAAIVAAGIAPAVAWSTNPERTRSWFWRPPAALVAVVIYLVAGVLLLVMAGILLRLVLAQGVTLAQRAPEFAAMLQDWHLGVISRWSVLDAIDPWDLLGGTNGLSQWIVGATQQILNVAGLFGALFGGLINVILVLFIALYLTIDGPSIRDYMLAFLPAGRRPAARRIVANIAWRLGQWVIGQLVVCVLVGIGAGIALALMGVPGAELLGLVWAVGVVIPGVGPFLSAVPTILLGFAAGPTTGVLATIFSFIWSQFENNILIPRVMNSTVKLNPLVVLTAVLVGHELLGVAGALFAIPMAAALAVVVDELHAERIRGEQTLELELPTPVAVGP